MHPNAKDDRIQTNDDFLNTMVTLETALKQSHDWAIDRIHKLSEYDVEAAHSVHSEFSEWLNPNILEHDIFSLQYLGD